MSRHIRNCTVLVLMIFTAIFLPRLVSSREELREVRIVAKDMTYRVEGVAGANPTLRFSPGEKVRVSLRNEDKGMLHDFGIPLWGVGTGVAEWSTEKTVTFRVPNRSADAGYICSPHSAMMSGKIILE